MMKTQIRRCIVGVILTVVGICYGQTLADDGGYSPVPVNNKTVVAAAAFAVSAQEKAMKKEKGPKNSKLALVKILSAKQQLVAGMNFRIELEIKVNKTEKRAEAVVYQDLDGKLALTSWKWISDQQKDE